MTSCGIKQRFFKMLWASLDFLRWKTQHRCLFELTINSCNLQQMGVCKICLVRPDKTSPWPLIWRQISFLVGYDYGMSGEGEISLVDLQGLKQHLYQMRS